MALTIKNKRSAIAASTPLATDLDYGEIGVNYSDTDPALYVKDSRNVVRRIAGVGAVGTSTPSKYSVANDDAGLVGSDATAAINAALIANADITAASDLVVSDQCEVTDSGNPGVKPEVIVAHYLWDGAVWVPNVSPDLDPFLLKAGDTMTGPLVLPAEPSKPLEASTKSYVDKKISLPTGAVTMFVGQVVPDGWLECDGSAIDPKYADLIVLVGPNLPDLRGEFVRGWDHGRGVDAGRAFGSSQTDEFKSHNHTTTGFSRVNVNPSGIQNPLFDRSGVDSTSIGFEGGVETRPRNVALMYIVKT